MKTGFYLLGGILALWLTGLPNADAQRGNMGGSMGPGGMRGNPEQMEKMREQMAAQRAFPAEAMWTALSLGMDIEVSRLEAIRVVMGDVWKKRQEWLAQAEKHGTWKERGAELARLRESDAGHDAGNRALWRPG